MLKTFISTIFLSLFCSCGCAAQGIDCTTVENLDLGRYLGSWHEVARIDSRYERNLVDVTAHYSLNDDGSIKVVNRGYNTRKEEWGEKHAKAVTTSNAGRLRVSFVPMIYSDYNILSIGEDYQWALVGSSSADYLWILSRTATLNSETLNHIVSLAEQRGYDTSKLLFL
ncbi:MAG: lipocalin family protein [Rikenellaceae bacterium]